jgi:adenosylcobinamide-GDP ribazoletransferase
MDACARPSERQKLKNAVAAIEFLTAGMRSRRFEFDPERVGKGVSYFPLVGLLLGSLLVGFDRLLEPYLGSEILSVVLVAVLALVTGAIHFEGLKRTFDGLSGVPAETPTAVGLLAILFIVALKIRSVEITGETRSFALLLSPMIARWSLVVFLYGAAVIADSSTRSIAENINARHIVITTLLTLGLAAFLIGRTALWIGLSLSVFVLLSRSFLLRRSRAIRHDHSGALIELSETLTFIIFSTL